MNFRQYIFLLALIAGCDGSAPAEKTPEEQAAMVLEARVRFPVVYSLHQGVFAASCASTAGVCHNAKEYPDLHTPGNLIAALGAPCNADKSAADMFQGCEPEADRLVLDDDSWSSAISWMGVEEWNDQRRRLYRRMILAERPPQAIARAPARIVRQGATIALLPHNLEAAAGAEIAEIHDLYELDYESLNAVRGGDPNRDGTHGAADPWKLIAPGDLERSYLWGRLQGLVPGTQMPPVSRGLSEPELLAVRCFIETAHEHTQPQDPIDYENCPAARAVVVNP